MSYPIKGLQFALYHYLKKSYNSTILHHPIRLQKFGENEKSYNGFQCPYRVINICYEVSTDFIPKPHTIQLKTHENSRTTYLSVDNEKLIISPSYRNLLVCPTHTHKYDFNQDHRIHEIYEQLPAVFVGTPEEFRDIITKYKLP